jgi:large subunit ribosomal protein L17
MKKNVFGRHFKRDANERKALFKNLLNSLVLEERITTSEAKAKAIRSSADKLVTKAKKGGTEAYRSLAGDVRHVAVEKLINQIAPRFTTRPGGYTRIIKVGRRIADNSPEVVMEWVEKGEKVVTAKAAKVKKSPAKQDGKKASAKQNVKKEGSAKQKEKSEVKSTVALGKPVKELKKVKSSAPKQMVTRQKKG